MEVVFSRLMSFPPARYYFFALVTKARRGAGKLPVVRSTVRRFRLPTGYLAVCLGFILSTIPQSLVLIAMRY